jgi:4-hydroxy-3-polyprenylbenzoate decarboxylase
MAATVSSGSFRTEGMIVAPCSMRTAAAIAHGNGENLVHRAADVVLKERRRLVLVPRETPLSEVHLENLLKLARMGVAIVPPMPAFYNGPTSIDDIVDHIVARVLDQFDIEAAFARRWDGRMSRGGGPNRKNALAGPENAPDVRAGPAATRGGSD